MQVSQFYVVDRTNGEILAQLDAELSEVDINASSATGLGLKGKAKNIRSVRIFSALHCVCLPRSWQLVADIWCAGQQLARG